MTALEGFDAGRSGTLAAAVSIACVAFLGFIIGGFTMYRDIFPAPALRGAFKGGTSLYDRLTQYADPVETDFWKPARTGAQGVIRFDRQKAQAGLTLYTSAHDQRAFLVDLDGRVVHEWVLPYSQVWDTSSGISRPQSDPFVYIEKAHVYPNGDLLALYTAIGDTPWGYGLVKMDRNARIIWKYLGHTHHDFSIDGHGNIYVLTQEISKAEVPGYPHLEAPRIDDFVVMLSPDGKEQKKMWLIGALAQSPFGRRFYFVHQNEGGDYLHTNSVQVLEKPVPRIPQSRAGQVLVSMREISTIALADLDKSRVVWASSGPWVRQHDAEFLPNGKLMLFDNEGNPNDYGSSRVLEMDPASLAVTWRYGGRKNQRLETHGRGSQSRLPNGNTMIVESYAGRIIETTPKGEIVWEFINPVRGGADNDRVPIIHWAERLDPGRDFTPEFRGNLERKGALLSGG